MGHRRLLRRSRRGRGVALHATDLLNPGLDACLANNARRPWEPQKYASLDAQNAMLATLNEWVADYYRRDDQWSYAGHRRIFDAHPGDKVEHSAVLDLSARTASGY